MYIMIWKHINIIKCNNIQEKIIYEERTLYFQIYGFIYFQVYLFRKCKSNHLQLLLVQVALYLTALYDHFC